MGFNKTAPRTFSLLGICSGLGQKHKGLEYGPEVLREAGILKILGNDFIDIGDIIPFEIEDPQGWSLIARVRERASQALQEGHRLFSIGGDHSVSIGTVQATLQSYPEARVVWVDAHGDINTPQTSVTGSLHGMPLAALLGLFQSPIGGPRLLPKNLLIVGVRDLEPAEKFFVEELDIEYITASEVLQNPKDSLDQVACWLKRDLENPIHLSFDIDALDPIFAPATGLRVPLGLPIDFSSHLVHLIAMTNQIISIDLMEFNPLKAQNDEELNQTIRSAKAIFEASIPNLL